MGINLNKTDGGVKVSLTKGASKAEIDNLYAQTLAAKVAAETAETNAETAETGAAGSATAAAGSATNASTSATAASASETAAANSATAAAASETAAASSETDSATSATASANSATASAGSATASANSATASAGSATTAASEATDSANSATASAASATASASSATDSATSATASAGSATASAASATAAAASETTVLASETNIEALFDAFDDRFLGTKTADPTLDNDGNALLEGAVYYNSVADDVRFYNGTSWDAPASDAYASEVAAATSATNAATSATNAATSATNAATSETNASASETLAATYAANAASSYDQFDDRYLGSKTADPALDNDGNALIVGALYFNTTDGVMKVYTASGWVNASSSLVATLSKFFFTATASQTVFSGTDDEGETFTCAPEFTLVTLNGVVLEDGSDYTATASAITLTAGANAGDELNVIAFANFESANFYTKTAADARYLLDSEVTNLAQVKAFDSADYATAGHNHTGTYQPLATVLTNTTASYTTAEETKLAGIETGATADQTGAEIKTAYEAELNTNAFTDADHSKLDGIEAGADVTDTVNVTAAGALMDSEVTNLAQVKAFNSADYAAAAHNHSGVYEPADATIVKDADIGVTVQAYDADTAKTDVAQTFTATQSFGDNVKAQFGGGNDLQIYHNGSHSIITDQGTGNLKINATSFEVNNAADSANIFDGTAGGACKLYHNGAEKLATTSTGVDVTGTVTADGLLGDTLLPLEVTAATGRALKLGAGGIERMRIDSSGNVGIGTTSPGAKLDIASTSTSVSTFKALNSGTNWSQILCGFNGTSVNYYDADTHNFRNGATQAATVRIESDGDLHADGDVIAYSTTISDERLKDNIQPIENALDKVSQLNGCTFTYTADGKESAGLIAQDVEKVLPSAVSEKELPLKTDDGETYKVLQYDQTIGLLVEAVKELTARVEELEAK